MQHLLDKTYHCDCIVGIRRIAKELGRICNVVVTSPPYAEQRKNQYGGLSEKDYPSWTVEWMEAVKEILLPNGSVFINIRPHIQKGQISDYVLETRLALRKAGWIECEEIIWFKPDSPPLGSTKRPRRAWESVLWFSLSHDPYCDPKANGTLSDRIGFENNKFEHGGKSHIHAGQNDAKQGIARCRDVIIAGTGRVEKGFNHPAMFPPEIPEYCIKMCCPENGIILDPFMGSGATARVAKKLKRRFIGFDINPEYVEMANQSVKALCYVAT